MAKKIFTDGSLATFVDKVKSYVNDAVSKKANTSHSHSISDVTNLQTTLNGKADTSHGTHVTYSSTAPLMDGTASVGSATTVARSDHKHPTDTSRAAQTSLDSHTSNTTAHLTSTERSNWNTSYTHSQTAHAPSNAEANQNAFSNVKVGDVTIAADIKTDTLTLVAGNNITLTPDATNDKITITAKDTTYTLGSFGITATAAELNKLDGVTATATEINYVDGVTSNIQTQIDNKVPTSRTINGKALSSNITLSASDIGADASGTAQAKADGALSSAKNYTDTKISALINSAPTTLDTLGEIATAMKENEDVVTALDDAIGTKANTSDLTSHTNNKSNPHNVTKAQIGLGNVENKSSATIRSELTKTNVTTALGYTPPTTDTTYGVATSSALGLIKSGTDITVDSSGNVSINDDSHNHTIANIDNLQTSLDGKQATVTGGASTITDSNLTANRALISNGSGKVAVSAVTSTELGYLDGVTSAIQTQLDGKAASSHGNHVPATQTANNAKFLRNDNTWQTVTPANIGAATSGHTHISLSGWSDTRSVDTVPNDYNGKLTVSGLKSNSTIGISGGGIYSGVVGFRSWSDSSGGNSQEIAFAANGNLYRRHGSTTEWGDWLQFIDSGNIGSQSVASATKATQDASGNVITSTYETKANATSKLTEAKTYTDTVAKGKANSSHTHDDRYYTETEINTKVDTLNSAINGKANASHTHNYAGSSSVGGDANNALKLEGYTRSNLYSDLPTWISAVGLTHTITVEGDKDTYYPVRIYLPSSKAMPTYISIHKNLGTKTPDIAGNHSNGTSSMWLIYEGRNRSWDGNGGYLKTWYKYMGYAELCSHTEVGTSVVGDLIVWLRGGGCTYDISKTNGTTESVVYYEETNLGSDAYPYVVAPRTDLGNKGVYRSTLGYGNIDGNASTATNVAWSGVTSKPSYYDAKAIKGITRSGTTFTYTCMDGTTGTFTQQDNNTTYSVATTSANGLMSSTDKSKLDGIVLATVSEVETYLGI